MGLRKQVFATLWVGLFLTLNIADSQSCKDEKEEEHCKIWKDKNYCQVGHKFRSYMESNCAKTCGFCVEVKKKCLNSLHYISKCAEWKSYGFCKEGGQYYKFMQDHCSLECEFCTVTKMDVGKPCADGKTYGAYCNSWKSANYCDKSNIYYGFMNDHCQKTCGFCKVTCKDHGDAEYCKAYQPYCKHPIVGQTVSNNCPKTCRVCQESVVCGKGPDKRASGRVVGGEEAVKNSWPWQAAMIKKGKFGCGGTLVAKKWVLTAAHCLRNGVTASDLEIVLGDHDRSKVEDTEQTFKVLRIVRHPKYNSTTKDNDIALLELSEEATLNKYVGLACLPTNGPIPQKSICYITGFGRTQAFGEAAKLLQEARLPVVTNEQCSILNKYPKVTSNMICAGNGLDFAKQQSGCQGDSGGPFVCQDSQTLVWTVQGAVSWGSAMCIAAESYTVFARVSNYVDWIKSTTANEQ